MKIVFTKNMSGCTRRGQLRIFEAGSLFEAEIKRIQGVDYKGIVDVLIGNYMLPMVRLSQIQVHSEEEYISQYVPSQRDKQRWIPADREESIWDGFLEDMIWTGY